MAEVGGRGRPLPPRKWQRSICVTTKKLGGGRGRHLPPRRWQRSSSVFRKGLAVAEVDLCHPRGCRGQLLKPMWGLVVAEVDLCHPGRGRGWRWQSSTSSTQEVAEVNLCNHKKLGGGRGRPLPPRRRHRSSSLFTKDLAVAEVDLCHTGSCRGQLLKPTMVAEVDLCHPRGGSAFVTTKYSAVAEAVLRHPAGGRGQA